MENINWIDLVLAGSTLITVGVSIFVLCKTDKSTRELLSKEHTVLSTEHTQLNTEHKSISKAMDDKTDLLSEKISTVNTNIDGVRYSHDDIKSDIKYLANEKRIEKGVRETLAKQELDINKTTEHISALVDLLKEQTIHIRKLQQENESLNNKLKSLEETICHKQEYGEDLEI